MSGAKGYVLLREQAARLHAVAETLLGRQQTEQKWIGSSVDIYGGGRSKVHTVPVQRAPKVEAMAWDTRVRAFLTQPILSPRYMEAFAKRCVHPHQVEDLTGGAAALMALIQDIDDGHLPALATTVHGDTLSDLMDQAEAKGPSESVAAVMLAGGVLEAHLRFLSEQRDLAIEGESAIGKWNEALAKADVYERSMKNTISSWAKLRNDADHLKVNKFTEAEVRAMIVGVRTLIQTHPQ